jgi:hypothetical protein
MAVHEEDSVLVAVGLGNANGLASTLVMRFYPDGSLDPTFGVAARSMGSITFGSGVLVVPNGEILSSMCLGIGNFGCEVGLTQYWP